MSRNFELIKQLEADVERVNLPRTVPETNGRQYTLNDAGVLFGEEIVALVQTVFLAKRERPVRHVVFCGVDGENGSSAVCLSAARALSAVTGKSVCLVDADVRGNRLSNALDVKQASRPFEKVPDLSERCARIDGRLWLAGTDLVTDEYGALLTAPELKHRFSRFDESFDFLLVDAPGIATSKDAAMVGEVAGAAILVVEANTTRRQAARRAKQTLEGAGVRLLGTVLRNRSFPIPDNLFKNL